MIAPAVMALAVLRRSTLAVLGELAGV